MKEKLRLTALACFCVFSAGRALSQLPAPVPPVNIIIDSDISSSVDDVGDHAVITQASRQVGPIAACLVHGQSC